MRDKGLPQSADHHLNQNAGFGLPRGWQFALELAVIEGTVEKSLIP